MALKMDTKYDAEKAHWMVKLSGELDIHSKSDLKSELVALLDTHAGDVVFDCEGLEYIDSTGLGVLIGYYKTVKLNDNTLYFENLRPNIMKIFSLTGLDKIFSIRSV